MRIGLVYDALYPFVRGGGERRNHELARRLSERHEVHLVSWRFWDGPAVVVRDGITLHGVGDPPRLYGSDGKRTVREAVAFGARLLPILLRHRFDVIDCAATPYVPLYAVWLASRLTRTPLVVTWHEFWGEHWHAYLPRRTVVARVARRLESWSRRLGDQLVAVSPLTARRLGANGDRTGRPLHVVGNGVDVAQLGTAVKPQPAIDIIFVGRLIDEKRVDLLLDAVDHLRARLPGLRCVVVGDGPQRAQLEAQAGRLQLGAHVEFRGALLTQEVQEQMRAARLLAVPSIREGFGITVVEAQACGTVPVVVRSPMSAATDLVRHGVDGLICDPTPDALAEALDGLLSEPERLRAMSAAAQRAAAGHDWDAVADAMERIYVGVARRSAQPVAST